MNKNFHIVWNCPDIIKGAGKVFLNDKWFANVLKNNWNSKNRNKWFINRCGVAIDMGLPAIVLHFEKPKDVLNYLEEWYKTIK